MTHDEAIAALFARIATGRDRYPRGCTILSLLDEAGEVAHAVNKGESVDRVRDELLDVAAVAMRLYIGEVDADLVTLGFAQARVDIECTGAMCHELAEIDSGADFGWVCRGCMDRIANTLAP